MPITPSPGPLVPLPETGLPPAMFATLARFDAEWRRLHPLAMEARANAPQPDAAQALQFLREQLIALSGALGRQGMAQGKHHPETQALLALLAQAMADLQNAYTPKAKAAA